MVLEELELADFRNFQSRKLAFSHHNIIFSGPNGSGKTNCLESIAFLSILRSFRNASPRELIHLGARHFTISGTVVSAHGRERLLVRENLAGQRQLFIGRAEIHRSSEFIREFHTVVFSPEDRQLTGGGSSFRRRFFDILISTVEPEYMLRLSRYNRALLQRNRALKHPSAPAAAFDGELAAQAPFIAARRSHYTNLVGEAVNRLLAGKAEVSIVCKTDTPASAEEFLTLLRSRRESENRRGFTLTGPHLDEFEINFNGKSLRTFGSTGQLRLISLLMKLAQFQLFSSGTNAPVAVLADDVTGELDPENLELFLNTISSADQCFFTFAGNIPEVLKDSEIIRM